MSIGVWLVHFELAHVLGEYFDLVAKHPSRSIRQIINWGSLQESGADHLIQKPDFGLHLTQVDSENNFAGCWHWSEVSILLRRGTYVFPLVLIHHLLDQVYVANLFEGQRAGKKTKNKKQKKRAQFFSGSFSVTLFSREKNDLW